MSNKDTDQTLIPKDDEEQWRKVLHGEIAAVEDNDTHVDAKTIRNYLIARDEAIAVKSIVAIDDINTISEEEARLYYHQASVEIQKRSKRSGVEFFKTYGAGALIGGLMVAVLFLGFIRSPDQPVAPEIAVSDELNYDDYNIIKQKESTGDFPNMLLIAGGTLSMGCATGWDDVPGGCRPTEFPSHSVNIKTFEMGQHEVTVGQFSKFVEETQYKTDAEKQGKGCVHQDMNAAGHPFVMNSRLKWSQTGFDQNEHYPVTCVSWNDAQEYIAWLSSETKTKYRLPTEAEWEYAARGGKSTAYFWGSSASHDQANFSSVGGQDKWLFTSPVGSFPANKFALQDTAGNVWEWVQDCWHKTYHKAPKDGSAWESKCDDSNARVRRGGAWDGNVTGIRSAIRSSGGKFDRSNLYGFRVARDWQKQK